jgi:hypothetical protein
LDKIFIIHFSPPELYPPLQNFIRLLEKQVLPKKIILLTTAGNYGALKNFKTVNPQIKIIRMGKSGHGFGKIARLFYYFEFYVGCLLQLLLKRPFTVLYYETLSSFPAYIYKRYFNRKAAIMVHYHEYTSQAEYGQGMFLNRCFHRREKWLYPKLKWLSHTNSSRLQLFLEDIKPVLSPNTHCIPNYPPTSWMHETRQKRNDPVRILYLGALSMDTMYTREMAEWVLAQKGKVIWEIFAYKPETNARDFIEGLNSEWVQLKEGVDYESLPSLITQYDIGVVLYNGHIPNYVYNAPNKLFEYLSAGLDVWYPAVMSGCYEYDSTQYWPKVLRLDFSNLGKFELNGLLERKENYYRPIAFNADDALCPLAKTLLQ